MIEDEYGGVAVLRGSCSACGWIGQQRAGEYAARADEASHACERPSRPRGVRLSDLDKSQRYVIGFNGRRWETLGPLAEVRPSPGRHAGPQADAERPEAAREPGERAAPDDGRTSPNAPTVNLD